MELMRSKWWTRLALLALVVTVFATAFPGEAGSVPKRASTSIGARVQGQKDLCWAGGGSTTVYNDIDGKGSVLTVCRGGRHDGMRCTNTTHTDCTGVRTQPPESLNEPPAGVVPDAKLPDPTIPSRRVPRDSDVQPGSGAMLPAETPVPTATVAQESQEAASGTPHVATPVVEPKIPGLD